MDLKWLKGLIALFPQLKNVSIKLLTFNINVTKNDNRKIVLQGRDATAYWTSLNKTEKEKLLPEIPKVLNEGRVPIMDQEQENLAQDIDKNINDKDDLKTIVYFSGKIPTEDLYILQGAIYIKKVFERGGDIEGLKNGIRNKYGNRGINICNLYSAGYFESWIKPLYESFFSSENFKPEAFLEAYELVVGQYPFAIFVYRAMSVKDVEEVAAKKIKECLQYGIKTLSLHGIGADNVVTILAAVEKIKEKYKFKADLELKGVLIVVKLRIRKD